MMRGGVIKGVAPGLITNYWFEKETDMANLIHNCKHEHSRLSALPTFFSRALEPVPAAVPAKFMRNTIRSIHIDNEVGEYHIARFLTDLASHAVNLETRLYSMPVRSGRWEEYHVIHEIETAKSGGMFAVEWVVEQLAEHPTIDKLVVPCQKKA